jgi:acetolactate synthase regulatory subunit
MNTYRIVARPDIRYAISTVEPPLTTAMLAQAIPDAIIREVSQYQWGPRVVDLGLDRDSHDEALNRIVSVLRRFGFSVAEVIVSEWASDAAEAAVRSVLGDGVVDAAATNPIAGALVVVAGAVASAVVSEQEQKLRARYEAHQLYSGAWSYTQIEWQSSQGQRVQPSFSPA